MQPATNSLILNFKFIALIINFLNWELSNWIEMELVDLAAWNLVDLSVSLL